jgi:hypothetical protein
MQYESVVIRVKSFPNDVAMGVVFVHWLPLAGSL